PPRTGFKWPRHAAASPARVALSGTAPERRVKGALSRVLLVSSLVGQPQVVLPRSAVAGHRSLGVEPDAIGVDGEDHALREARFVAVPAHLAVTNLDHVAAGDATLIEVD